MLWLLLAHLVRVVEHERQQSVGVFGPTLLQTRAEDLDQVSLSCLAARRGCQSDELGSETESDEESGSRGQRRPQ